LERNLYLKRTDNVKPQRAQYRLLKKLYDWVLSWANTPYGTPALFILSLVESSFFPIPPDPLLLALGISKPKKALWYATVCTVGSVVGGILGYCIGYFFIESIGIKIIELYGLKDQYIAMQSFYEEWNALVVLVAGISPIPYKVFTIAGGAFKISIITFIVASLAGRGFRFYIEGLLAYKFGESIKIFIDKYLAIISWLFAILLIGGFVLVRFALQ
jgi:membrane protein YqaA with SNARE-associated domain